MLLRHFEITALFVGLRTEKRDHARHAHDEHQEQDEVELRDQEINENRNAHQPQPGRNGRNDPSAIQESDGHQIKQVNEESAVGQPAKKEIAGREIKSFANQGAQRTQQRPANSHNRLNPGIARRFLQQDQRTQERDEHRRAYFEAESFGRQQVPAFVDEQQQNESDRKPNAPKQRINSDAEKHGAAGFQQEGKKFEASQQGKLEFGEQRDNAYADRSQRFFYFFTQARTRSRWWLHERRRSRCRRDLRRLWRRRQIVRLMFIWIHAGPLCQNWGQPLG